MSVAVAEKAKATHPLKVRFSDAPWYQRAKNTTILLLGSGGIGSWVGFGLARIGFPYMVYDMDVVEDHNLGGQLFNTEHVGKSKTDALIELCKKFAGSDVKIYKDGKYTEDSGTNDIVIAAFDNMAARKLAFTKWCEHVNALSKEEKIGCIFIDGRLLAEDYQVYAVTHDRMELYKATLFSDEVVEDVMCTLKSTTHCSMGIASDIIAVLTNHIASIDEIAAYGSPLRDVPYKIVKSIPMFTYEIKTNNE